MPRTAPVVDGTPITVDVALRFIDSSGDLSSDSYTFPPTVTAAEIDAWADAMADASNADLYEIVVRDNYSALPNATNADDNVSKEAVENVVTVLFKNPAKLSHTLVIRAPKQAIFVEGVGGETDELNPESTELDAAIQAYTVLINKASGGFDAVSGRYTARKDTNQKVNL